MSFEECTFGDILVLNDSDCLDETDFAAAASLSELSVEFYNLTLRPFVQALTPVECIRQSQPALSRHPREKLFAVFAIHGLAASAILSMGLRHTRLDSLWNIAETWSSRNLSATL